MMAFTFSGASTRHDNRKELLLQEVNAIGTTYLRAGLLREPHKSRIRKLLREYVDIRAGLVNAVKSKNGLQKAIIRSEALLEMLWSHARNVAESDPNSEITPIFIEALNDMIDMHTKRVVVATQYRIPAVIWAFLTFVAVISMALVGFQFGLTNRRSHLAQLSLALAFSAVLLLIVDLDRPIKGWLTVSQQPMSDLQRQLNSQEPRKRDDVTKEKISVGVGTETIEGIIKKEQNDE